jgi:hypothetical protein
MTGDSIPGLGPIDVLDARFYQKRFAGNEFLQLFSFFVFANTIFMCTFCRKLKHCLWHICLGILKQ